MNMTIEGSTQGQGLGPVENPHRTVYGVALAVEDARLFSRSLQMIAIRNMHIAIDSGLFPHTASIDHDASRDLQGRVVLRLGDEFGLLTERFPEALDHTGDETVRVDLNYHDVELLNRAVWNGDAEAGKTRIEHWPDGQRHQQRARFMALWRLMDRFVGAGGPDNPEWRRRNETVLTEERVWGAVPEETPLT